MSDGDQGRRSRWTPERVAALGMTALIAIIGGVVLGLFVTVARFYYIAAVASGALVVLLVAWRFEAALVVYALVAFVPWGKTPDLAVGGSGTGKGVYVSEALLGFLLVIWVIRYLLSMLPEKRIGSGFYLPVAVYMAYSVLNVVHSFIFWDHHVNRMYQYSTVNGIELGFRFLSAGALVMFATTISNRVLLKWMTVFILVPGFYNLANAVTGHAIPVIAAWWPLVTLLCVSYCWAVALDPNYLTLHRILAGLAIPAAVLTILIRSLGWMSGWAGLIAALLAVAYLKDKRVFAGSVVLLIVVSIVLYPAIMSSIVKTSMQQGDYDRFSLMAGALKYAVNFPLGVGLGNYRSYNSFHYGELWGTTSYTSAHGTYSQHLSEMGIPGLILFLAILVCGFRWMAMWYRKLPPGLSKTYLLAACGQMAGIAVSAGIGDYIIPTYHNGGLLMFSATIYSWMIWGLAIAHVRIAGAPQVEEAQS